LVIEHNLDVIRAADWIIDLGPEGGERGGEIICAGTAAQLRAHPRSFTGEALRAYAQALSVAAKASAAPAVAEPRPHYRGGNGRDRHVVIHKAREHNLKNIDVEIPRDRFTVITGVSGSGKSTLAFDILFNEGQRRYLESLNAYARQFVQPAARPDVDAIFGIPPTVAIEQRTSRGGRKSTVGTLTEVHHFLRLLFVKLGTQYCPDCEVPIEPQSEEAIAARILREYRGETLVMLAPLVVNRKGVYTELDPRLFSYNSKHGWCAACYGTGLKIDDVQWEEERARTGAEDNVLDSWIEWLEIDQACPQCEGRRLNPEALAVLWRGKNISEY